MAHLFILGRCPNLVMHWLNSGISQWSLCHKELYIYIGVYHVYLLFFFKKKIYLCTNPLGYGYFLLTSSIISVFTIWTGPKLHLQKHLPTNHSFPVAHPVIYFIYKLESVGGWPIFRYTGNLMGMYIWDIPCNLPILGKYTSYLYQF